MNDSRFSADKAQVSDAVRLCATGEWPTFLGGTDVFRVIILIEAMAMVGAEKALEKYGEIFDDAIEDQTWIEYLDGHAATLQTLPLNSVQQDEYGCADPETAAHYATLSTKAPPLFIKDGVVLDGKHRLEAAITRGDTTVDAYIISGPAKVS